VRRARTTGTTVVHAAPDISVSGQTVQPETDGARSNSGNPTQRCSDLSIAITPATATNPAGTNHTLTITVNALGAGATLGSGTASASIVSGPGSFVVGPTCNYTGGGATATCVVAITSATAGGTAGHPASGTPPCRQSHPPRD